MSHPFQGKGILSETCRDGKCKSLPQERFVSNGWSQPISRVLSWTVIHLGQASPLASSNLPEPDAGRTNGFLFGLAPSGVYRAASCCQLRGALLPHPFTLTGFGLP